MMRSKAGLCALLPLVLFAAPARAAAPAGSSWQVTPFGGYFFFYDPVRLSGGGRVRLEDAFHAGGRLGYQFNPRFGIEAAGGFTPTKIKAPGGRDVDVLHLAGDFLVSPIAMDSWDLYGLVGVGYGLFSPSGLDDRFHGLFDTGAGVRLWLNPRLALRLEGRNVLMLARASRLGDSRDNAWLVGGGLTLALGGKPRDKDGDGVPDNKDGCPDTPAGVTVDARGCPVDSDGDGVADGPDQCADTPRGAAVDARGCPTDADKDGVADGLDRCGDTPAGATVDPQGCPVDSDGDGVFDGIDRCAATPRGAEVDATGCPKDTDQDGVVDGLDKCPGTAAGLRVDVDGCPIEVTEKETELLDTGMIRLENVNFETAKATILPESHATLDIVGQVLGKWPELRIEVAGHTDSRGSDAYNQRLSDARARSVMDYLVQKFPGLKAEQFTAKGYGESRPLVPNTSALNMSKNRRVEFVVLNTDVLRREVERRKAVPK